MSTIKLIDKQIAIWADRIGVLDNLIPHYGSHSQNYEMNGAHRKMMRDKFNDCVDEQKELVFNVKQLREDKEAIRQTEPSILRISKKESILNKEDLSREQAIVDQANKTKVLDQVKSYPSEEENSSIRIEHEDRMTIAEYILYLENQISARNDGISKPPSPKGPNWIQKDIQIIMKDSGVNGFLEDAKIINLSGRVLVHRAERDFIRATLDEAPADMRFTLIEEMPRIQKRVTSASTSARNVTINFSDGSSEVVAIEQKGKKGEDWE